MKVDVIASADCAKLVALLLDQPWHKQCEIIPAYMPPYPSKNTRPSVQIHFKPSMEHNPCLRYSAGPKQGFFWDICGDDMLSIELAIIALSQAPSPVSVVPITFSLGLGEKSDE